MIKYKIWYDKIIERAKNRTLSEGYEIHHIIPRFDGGLDNSENLVKLTLREHYVCHLLLTKIYDGMLKMKAYCALHKMCFSGKYGNKSRLYETFRTQFIENLKLNHPSKINVKKFSDVSRENALNSWKNADERRRDTSERMKKLWLTGKLTKEHSRMNGRHNLFGKNNHKTLKIEYKNEIYWGWNELKEKTGVSKALYKKYYLNNIDPEYRIGKNGPEKKCIS